MHPDISAIFDEAENRYLKPEELTVLNQYVTSLPSRVEAYRALRDKEMEVMQQVADQLQAEMPHEKIESLERSIRNALLVLRYCAMGMLLNNDAFVEERLLGWLSTTTSIYQTQAIDTTLYRLLVQRLAQALTPNQLSLLTPEITKAQTLLLQPSPASP